MASTHRALGFAVGAAYGQALGLAWPAVAAAGAVAVVTSAGQLSPDADQFRWWRRIDQVVPDEALGHAGPLQHRGITHWWVFPALLTACWVVQPARGGWVWMAAGALLAGWWSHLLGDMVFGRADRWSGRGPGIPLMPWWGHFGAGLRCGGAVEVVVGLLLVPAGAWIVAASAGAAAGLGPVVDSVTVGWSR